MNSIISPKIAIRNIQFTGINKSNVSVKHLAVQSSPIQNTLPKNLNPAYFHPSFCATPPEQIAKFSHLLDSVLADPQRASKDDAKRLECLLWPLIKPIGRNFINSGVKSRVYRLNDKYVIKTPRQEHLYSDQFRLTRHPLTNKLKTWYGNVVATYGNISILRNADPDKIALPLGLPYDASELTSREIEEKYNETCLPKLLAMPQKAFDDIADDFANLNITSTQGGEYYAFDTFNPNNFLLVGDKIKIVDDINEITVPNQNNLAGLLEPTVLRLHVYQEARFNQKLAPAKKEIFKKCILANEHAELPMTFNVLNQESIERSFAVVGINTPQQQIFAKLASLRKTIPNMEERLSAVADYIDELKILQSNKMKDFEMILKKNSTTK